MAAATVWTEEQKTAALALAGSKGVNEAARLTGISSGTIKSWRKRNRPVAGATASATKAAAQNEATATPPVISELQRAAGRFVPGVTGNPLGGRRAITTEAIRKAEAFAPEAIDLLIEIARNPKSGSKVRVEALTQLLDRALGKPKQQVDVTHDLMRDEARRLAEELGLDEESLIREAEAILLEQAHSGS